MTTQSTYTLPTIAERVRSAFMRADCSMLAIDGTNPIATTLHHFDCFGGILIGVPEDCAAAALAWQAGPVGLPVVLELTDAAPLDLREPIRSLIWVRGQLTPIDTDDVADTAIEIAATNPNEALLDLGHTTSLLHLDPASVVVADASGAEIVPLHTLIGAHPDPFCRMETRWLRHLESEHADLLDSIISKLPPSVREGRLRLLGLDRYGLRLRIEREDHDKDIRIAFPQPVNTPDELNAAMRILVGCPHFNGTRT
ncbi:DUF2470 domain-containing protein [Hoyosella rhizosphaerae]|uniref:Prephenate dehydratase n=1 Tax=Hoyosella rhizosphaerae TaxID=1755582 RepID=A0A916U8P1_9ACTN|nr:DUF2470 domain-containing protein [Hoyosella rhizosphaerae]MBN4927411.1 DUF2470 domain-containing protein [Hoyosella rhizosphaerae]GGC64606.1 prephenate dehydratase [Hoyosella rhizosphaerae]